MTLRRLVHWGPIIALTIITLLFISSMLTILTWIPPFVDGALDTFGVVHLLMFLFWVVCLLRNFFKASYLGPGHLPYRWKPELQEHEDYLQFCEPCLGFKAPRAHHCKNCKRCVLKMDHHCPWINNCVGHYNHKSFTLFLFFVVVGCSHSAIITVLCIIDHLIWIDSRILLKVDEDALIPMSHYVMICLFFGIGLSIGVTVAVGVLLYYQMKSIMRNETGIEAWIVEKAQARTRCVDEVFIYPYDLGLFENIQQVLTWSYDYVGDGITWEVFEGCDQYGLTIEQLEQKYLKRERTIIYAVTKSFNGAWFPISLGMRVCYAAPWSEEARLSVEVGDVIHATRLRKRWVYGEKEQKREDKEGTQSVLGEEVRQKGWIPRCCVEELDEDGITVLKKKNS